jgi:release factor glutamine methyltransferase
MAVANVGDALTSATQRLRRAGSESARLDAELLLGHVLHVDRASLLAHPEVQLGSEHLAHFATAVNRREKGEPVAYIRGLKEFFGIALVVDRRALIPRPETERLVELVLDRLHATLIGQPRPDNGAPLQVWDVGTGCGAVVVALAVEARRRGYGADVRFLATDSSPDALALAVENAVVHGVADVIDFGRADLLDHPSTPVELVAANLPYIPSDDVPRLPVAASFEPRAALDGGPDGLAVIRRLLDQLPTALVPGGACLLEIGADQADRVLAAAGERLPAWPSHVELDLGGQPRVTVIERPANGA